MKKMLSVAETAQEFGLSERLIYGLIREQKIVAINSGKKYLVNSDKLNEYLDNQYATPNGESPLKGRKRKKAESHFTAIPERL